MGKGVVASRRRRTRAVIARLRRARVFIKSTAVVVTVAFLGLCLQPLAAAARLSERKAPVTKADDTSTERFSRTVEVMESKLEQLEEKLNKKNDASREKRELKLLSQELEVLDQQITKDFDKIEVHLKREKLPQVILDRHTEAVRTYRSEMAILKSHLDSLEIAKDDTERKTRAQKAREHLKAKQKKRVHAPVDPNNLPFRVPDAKKTRKPAEKKEDFQKFGLVQEERIQLASTELLPGMLTTVAALALPAPADLQSTEDVQITPEVQALATALEHNPVKIYNWVRNNIVFTPTYGSVQGSQGCFDSRECNAADTASLLIAILRASNIPARYIVGTVDIPIDKFMSWVGDFSDPRATLDFVASGGVPITGIVSGGKIAAARMEHVWVEAYIDYNPSWGAVHKQGDTWVPLDAALKPHHFQKPLDAASVLGIDPKTFYQPVLATAIQSPDGYSLTNLSQTALQDNLSGFVTQYKNYLSTQAPNATIGQVLGALAVEQKTLSALPVTLQSKIVAVGGRFAALPDNMRTQLTIEILDLIGISPVLSLTRSTAALATSRLTLGYVPASAADVATVTAYGGLYLTPPYLIQMRPVLYFDGAPLVSGSAVPMGTAQQLRTIFQEPDGSSDTVNHNVTAGTFSDIGINLGRVSTEQLQGQQARLKGSTDGLGSTDVPWDDVIGQALYLHALTYFAQTQFANRLAANVLNVAVSQRTAEAMVSFSPVFAYMFGLPRAVVDKQMMIDARRYVLSPASRSGDAAAPLNFMEIAGSQASAAESGALEMLQRTQAVSAVQLLAVANAQSIPVFRIDSSNIAQVLSQLALSASVITDIQNAVATGKVVFVPKTNVTVARWNGAGYIILDPATGAGAYLIEGGLAGGGTAGSSSLLDALSDFVNALDVAADFLSLLAKGGVALTQALRVLEAVGLALGILSAIVTALDIYNKTNSGWASIAAGLIDASLTYVAGASAALYAPLLFPGGLAVGTVLFALAVAIGAAIVLYLVKTIIFEFFFGVAEFRRRISVARNTNMFWLPGNNFVELYSTRLAST